jgi:glycine/D-amino acid oxidase-like deaminating enzyme
MPAYLGAEIGVRRDGGYKIAMNDTEAQRLDDVLVAQRAVGLNARRLSPAEIRQDASWISPDCMAASFSPQDGYASPTLVGPALRRKVESLGVTIVENAAVTAISRDSAIRVDTQRGTFRSAKLAITAGAWSATVAAMLGVHLPISLDVNMISVTEPARPTIGKIVTHARGILTLKQVANGSCLIGGGWQGIGAITDTRKEIDYDQVVHNLRLALRVIPGLAELNVLRSWAGYEGVTPDSYPFLGLLPGHRDVYCAACARGGFTLGPLMGRLLGELIAHGQASRPIEIFNPGRFAHAA